jgi:hypothetical protein
MKHLKKLVLTVVGVLICLEITGWAIIYTKKLWTINCHPKKNLFLQEGIEDPSTFLTELSQLYDNYLMPDENKWYRLRPNFNGRYHKTDRYGYRNSECTEKPGSIGLFGGSTVYGVCNTENQTISKCLELLFTKKTRVYNFGIGGYSSQSELQAFAEILRIKDYNITKAIFYDGVNEVFRYIENLQDHGRDHYQYTGYPYNIKDIAFKNYLNGGLQGFYYQSSSIYIHNKIKFLFTQDSNYNYILKEKKNIYEAAKTIVDIYEFNHQAIQGIASKSGITTHFFWQPNLFYVEKKNLQSEYLTLVNNQEAIRDLFIETRNQIMGRESLKDVILLDSILNQVNIDNQFFDTVHVNGKINQIIAENIFLKINKRDKTLCK